MHTIDNRPPRHAPGIHRKHEAADHKQSGQYSRGAGHQVGGGAAAHELVSTAAAEAAHAVAVGALDKDHQDQEYDDDGVDDE